MYTLDDIINATNSPRIVSEEHNTGNIAVDQSAIDAAVRGASGTWDAAEYGLTAAQVAERIAAANTPEARERVMADLRARGIARANLDTSNGRVAVMVAGKAAWHRLGVNVESAVNSADAMRLASLDWSVSKRQLAYQHPIGGDTWLAQEEVYAIVRDDTGGLLGTVGSRYAPIQNADGFEFLDSVLGAYGAKYETCGAIYGGRKVWMLVHLPAQRFAVNGNDMVEPYALFTNPHDGSGQAWCFPTTERVVCANTFRIASKGKESGIGIRHTGSVKSKIKDAQEALGLAVEGFQDFSHAAEAMAKADLPNGITHYASDVLDAVLDVTAAQALLGADALAAALKVTEAERDLAAKSFARKIERRGEVLADIMERYESERCGIGGMRGSVWSGFNAVTEHADFGSESRRKVGSTQQQQERRFESTISGDLDQMKQVAYTTAMQYV